MAKGNPPIYTGPNPNGKGWVNKAGGEVISNHYKKKNAVEKGREIAQDMESEHIIANMNGQIAQKNSYGNDPRKTKG
jgi:hypothetical protein